VLSRVKFVSLLAVCLLVAACSQSSNTEQVLAPTPIAPQTAAADATDVAGGSAPNQTALVPTQTETPAQNVVDQQIKVTNTTVATPEQTQVAALDPGKSISFLPVEGMPQSAISSFSKSIKEASQTHGLNLVPANQPAGKYRVKGYFSALNDGSGTLITYIWDVVDASGKRLHRINGQERNGSKSIQPWSTVTSEELKKVADTTASRLKSWVDSRS